VPPLPSFVDSWLGLLEPGFRERCERLQSHHFVYISAPGGVTPLHHDFWDTHAFLAQVVGRKHAILFDPRFMAELYRDSTGDVRAMMRDPEFGSIEGWCTDLTPGDLLVIPGRWLHYVETLETSITYSADWIDANNWRRYLCEATAALAKQGEP
jgi:ribosomal protein L16 Arg81 hydroxylase